MSARQRLAAYAVVRDDAGRVLLARQPDGRRGWSRWLLPGGGVEPGEHPEEAVLREVVEETGLHVQVEGLLCVLSDVSLVGRRHRRLHNVRLVYRVTSGGTPGRPFGESEGQARWCSPEEIRQLDVSAFTLEALAVVFG